MKLSLKFLFFTIGLPSLALFVFILISYQNITEDKTQTLNQNANTLALTIAQQLDSTDWMSIAPTLKRIIPTQAIVFNKEGQIVATSNASLLEKDLGVFLTKSAEEKYAMHPANEGSFEDYAADGRSAIFNFVRLPEQVGTLMLVTKKDDAFRSVFLLIAKSVAVFFVFILIGFGTSLWFARSVSAPLEMIADHTHNLASGNFNICLPNLGQDELGSLGDQFNSMIQKLRKSLSDREKSLKIEFEKEIAIENQRIFYPSKNFKTENIEICTAAISNLLGEKDWWYYSQTPTHLIVCMIRLPSLASQASILSAVARTSLGFIAENFSSTAKATAQLHRSLLECTKGSFETPCLFLAIELSSGLLSYTSAGFRPPLYVFNATADKQSEDLEILEPNHNRGVGRTADDTFQNAQFQLSPQSTLFIHSSGLYQIKNPKMEHLSLETIELWMKETNANQSNLESLKVLTNNRIKNFRGNTDSESDLTYMFIRWSPHVEKA